jgi:capsular exopolysaccharide synthesis family protein
MDGFVYRYWRLLKQFWWILFLTGSAGVFLQAWLTLQKPISFASSARMIVSGQIALPNSSYYQEEVSGFYETQSQLMQSGEVQRRAASRVKALRPDLTPAPVLVKATVGKGTSIFNLTAVGPTSEYTSFFLNAVMEEYLNYKREVRSTKTDLTATSLGGEILNLEKDLKEAEEALLNFQSANNLSSIEEAGNDAAKFLAELKRRLATEEQELDLLKILTLDQTIDRAMPKAAVEGTEPKDPAEASSGVMSLVGPQADYLRARQQVQILRAELTELPRIMRPKHPKIVQISDDIRRQENLIEIFRVQSIEQLGSRKKAIELEIQNLNTQVKDWEKRAIEASRGKAEFDRLRGSVERSRAQLARYEQTQRDISSTRNVESELVSIMERASPPVETRPDLLKSILLGLAAGLIAGCGLLFLLDRIDDRISSQTDFEGRFSEYIIGHVPQTGKAKNVELLIPKDERHTFAEAFRNIRSSLFYMPCEGERPQSFMITSATPSEGKSTISANLAITMAVAGSKVLLVDGDLRRGALHSLFSTPSAPGFSEVIRGSAQWQETALKSHIPNLDFIPRGESLMAASEHFLQDRVDAIVKDLRLYYEYIIFDSPPVLAADDATSFAPKLDAVIFVLRLSQTIARQAHRSLELLYGRQSNVIGVILNCTNPSMPEYKYYYQYSGYYKDIDSGKEKSA